MTTGETSLFDDDSRGAVLSPCGQYRYDLWRRWDDGPLMAWIMLNPSTGDAVNDDQTLQACMRFARREGAAGIVVRNLFAFRTPHPKVLIAALKNGVDVVGPDADLWLRQLADFPLSYRPVLAAWGAGGGIQTARRRILGDRVAFVKQLLGARLHRLVIDGQNAPHPLYRANTTPIGEYAGGAS